MIHGRKDSQERVLLKLLQRVTWVNFYEGKLWKRWKMHFRDVCHLEKRASQAIYTLTSCNYCLKINPQGCSFPIISTLPVSEKAFRHGNRMAAGHHPVHPKMQSLSIQVGYQQHLLHPSYLSLFPLSLCTIILNNHFLKLPYSKTFSDSVL